MAPGHLIVRPVPPFDAPIDGVGTATSCTQCPSTGGVAGRIGASSSSADGRPRFSACASSARRTAPRLVVTTTPSPPRARRQTGDVFDQLFDWLLEQPSISTVAGNPDGRTRPAAPASWPSPGLRSKSLTIPDGVRSTLHRVCVPATVARGGLELLNRLADISAVQSGTRWPAITAGFPVCPRRHETPSITVSGHRFQPSEGPSARRACRRCRSATRFVSLWKRWLTDATVHVRARHCSNCVELADGLPSMCSFAASAGCTSFWR